MTWEGVEQFNRSVRDWGGSTKKQLLQSLMSMGLHRTVSAKVRRERGLRKTLYQSVGVKYRSSSGEIYFVSFPFLRHGIYLVKGVSRSHKLGNPRQKQDWITPVMDVQTRKLADIVTDHYGEAVQNEAIKVLAGNGKIVL